MYALLAKAMKEVSSDTVPTAQVNDETKDHLSRLHKTMKSKGYKHEPYRHSALEGHRYTHPNGTRFEYNGWHGMGKGNRKYGVHRLAHGLYHTNAKRENINSADGKYGPAVEHKGHLNIEHPHHDRAIPKAIHDSHNKFWSDTHAYINKHA